MVVTKVILRCDGEGCGVEADGEVEVFHHAGGFRILKRPPGWGWGQAYLGHRTFCPPCLEKFRADRRSEREGGSSCP